MGRGITPGSVLLNKCGFYSVYTGELPQSFLSYTENGLAQCFIVKTDPSG